MTRILLPLFLLAACTGTDPDPGETGDTGSTSEACELAADSMTCPECSEGPSTCTFGETSATANSCGHCQARSALYTALCEEGSTADRATIEADTVCGPAACVVVYDTCTDPCEPLCLDEGAAALVDTSCDLGCTMPNPEPGVCENQGFGCGWTK